VRLVHEQDVGVRAVPLLPAAEPAHREHGHRHRQRGPPLRLDLAGGRLERRGEHRAGDVGQRRPHLTEVEQPEQVGAGDAQQLVPAHAPGSGDRALPVVAPPGDLHEGVLERRARPGDQLVVGGEQAHRLRRPAEQVGDVAGRREQPGQALGGLALVAQQAQVPGRAAERVRHLPERLQPGVRVGGVGEPAEHRRQQRLLDHRAPRDAGRQRLEVAQGDRRLGEAERLQAGLRRGRGEPGLLGGQPGDRAEQGAVEELLVQPPDLVAVAGPLAAEGRQHVLAVADGARQPAQRDLVVGGRQQVRAAQPVQLQAVLDGAQPPVGLGEVPRVLRPT
jgi:hypothetical protein